MSASVFISYASQDQKVANTLCKALEGRGFSCWIASRNIAPGENFQIAIVRAIRGAKIMLLVFTGNSNNSDEMAKELALASQSKLIVVPLLIDDVRPNDAFSYEFATRQWIDFFSDWETAIEQLAHRIAAALATETPAAQPAPPEAAPAMPAPTPDVIARAFADQPAAAAAPADQTLSGLTSSTGQTMVDPAGKTAVMSAPELAAASPAAAALATGPSSFQDAPVKRGAPVVLIVTLSLLVIVMIAGAAVILPSFLAKKPTAPTAVVATNTVTALTTTAAPPPTPPLVTQPTTATPGPAPMASVSPGPTAETPVQPTAAGPAPAEDPDLDPETHRAGARSGRHHGGGGGSSGGGSADVPF